MLLVAVEQVHIHAFGPLILDLQRKHQHVSLTEIKVWKVEPTLPNTPRQYAQRFCTKSWAASGTACKKGQAMTEETCRTWQKMSLFRMKRRHSSCCLSFWKCLLWLVMLSLFKVTGLWGKRLIKMISCPVLCKTKASEIYSIEIETCGIENITMFHQCYQ